MVALYSELAAVTGSGAVGDYIDFMKLPQNTVIVGGFMYIENGLGGDNETVSLGIIYEDSDGTDDPNALVELADVYDGATAVVGQVAALPAGFNYFLSSANVPYKVTGGVGTVRLTSNTDALDTNKDSKVILYVILPA